MNKKQVDRLIPKAYEVLRTVQIDNGNDSQHPFKIVETGGIQKAWRGQISSFGAAIATGSLPAAISFFSAKGHSELHRELLMKAIFELLEQRGDSRDLFDYVSKNTDKQRAVEEEIVNRAIALKFAMNLYPLV